jgi:N-acetylglucosamine-6-sulfatase
VDKGVGQIFEVLKRTKELDNAVIVFAGDNGYFHGEHCLSGERRLAYDESVRIPLLVGSPGAVKPRTGTDELALDADRAPALLGLASQSRTQAGLGFNGVANAS